MLNSVDPIMTAIRSIFIVFDACVYYFVNFGFEMLFNIATFNIVDRKMIFDLISRVQLIIGIFMLFQLAMTIIKGIVNPDSFTDSKNGGAGNVIMRIIVSLVLLALLVPLNISSPKNEYEKQLNNNGVLFGTLYSLQYRILTNDTLGRIIIGDDSTNYTAGDEDGSKLSDFANNFTTTVVKSFYTLNVDDEGNYVCGDGWDEAYANEKMTAHEVIANGIRVCGDDSWPTWIKELADHSFVGQIVEGVAGVKYSLSMSYIASTVVGVVLLVLLAMMIFNVATRVFKLVALQILAPIPVISYMDPKGSKDSAFNSWLKLLGTTYLELFIQLGVIYFAISIIHSFMERFPMLAYTAYRDIQAGEDTASFVIGAVTGETMVKWTFIIMTIALFIFAKDAPKFFKQMLGMKDDGKGFFSAFGTAMGLGVAAYGAIGSFNANRQASRDADIARAKNYAKQRGWNEEDTNRYVNNYANRMGNRAKHGLSGLFGAGLGVAAGSAAASESKGNALAKTMASLNAMNSRNSRVRAAGRDGGTFMGGLRSLGQEVIFGQNEYDRLEADWKAREQKVKDKELVLKNMQDMNAHRQGAMDRSKSKAIDSDKTFGVYKMKDAAGNVVATYSGNYRKFHSAYEAAVNNGYGVHTQYVRADGSYVSISDPSKVITKADFDAMNAADQAKYSNVITKAEFDSKSAAEQAMYKDDSWFDFTYTDAKGNQKTDKIKMSEANDIDLGLKDANTANFYEQVVKYEQVVNDLMTKHGLTKEQATARAKAHGIGIDDTSILADRESYREAKISEYIAKGMSRDDALKQKDINMEDVYDGAAGLKAMYGIHANENKAKSDELNRERRQINDERQGYEGQAAAANKNKFRSGKNGS